jgi:hypothetical protein
MTCLRNDHNQARHPPVSNYQAEYRRETASSKERAKLTLSEMAAAIFGLGRPISSRAKRTATMIAEAMTSVETKREPLLWSAS